MRHIRDHLHGISSSVPTPVGSERPTQQQYKDQCTVSSIVRRFQSTGQLPSRARTPLYGDFSQATDLKTAMDLVHDAQAEYGALSQDIQDASGNDPTQLLSMLASQEGCEILEAAGLEFTEALNPDLGASDFQSDSPKSEKEKDLSGVSSEAEGEGTRDS